MVQAIQAEVPGLFVSLFFTKNVGLFFINSVLGTFGVWDGAVFGG
jgi:hypothetical protein